MSGRRIWSILAIVIVFMLSACTGSGVSLTDYQNNIRKATVQWEYGVAEYTADITFDGEVPEDSSECRAAAINFTSPEELTGLSVRFADGTATASVGKVKLDLPESAGRELYLLVKLFSLYPVEMAESTGDSAKFRMTVDGEEAEFDVSYKGSVPKSAIITAGGDEIKVTEINVSLK